MEKQNVAERIKKILGPREEHSARFVESHEEILEIVKRLRDTGNTIVYTSGAWDIKHIGQELYLAKARDQGDILIVGCDTDEILKRKGKNRPIVPMTERVGQLANLRSVHIVIPVRGWDEDDEFIRKLKPEVLVRSTSTDKNTENHTQKMKEKFGDFCGKIIVLEPQATTSTTARIRKLMLGGFIDVKEKIEKFLQDLHKEFELEEEGGSK